MPPNTATAPPAQQLALGQQSQFESYLQHQSSDIRIDDSKTPEQPIQQWTSAVLQSSPNLTSSYRLDVKTHVFKKELQEYIPTRSEDHLRIETIIYVELSIVTQKEGTVVKNYDYVRLPRKLFFNMPDKVMAQEDVASKRIFDVSVSVQSPSNGWRVEEEACMRCSRRMSAKLDENESRIMHILPELYRTEDGDGLVHFRSGVANLQMKINCYCGHKKEREGFVIRFDSQSNSFASSHVTTPLMFYHQNKNRIASRAQAAAIKAQKRAEKLQQKEEYTRARNVVKSVSSNTKREPRSNGTESPRHNPLGHDYRHIPSPPDSLVSSPSGYSVSPGSHDFLDHSDITVCSPSQPDPMTSLFPELSSESSVIESQQQPVAMISHMTPNTGPTRGGTLVTIHGSGFIVGEMMYVCFGETFVPVIPQHSQMVECFTPARSNAETVSVFALLSTTPTNPPAQCTFTYVDDNEKELIKLALQRIMNISARMEGPLETVMHRANELAMWSEILGTDGLDDASTQPAPYSSLEKMIMGSFKLLDTPTSKNSEGLSIINSTGHTMLHLSVALQLESLAKDLISRGIDMGVKDKNGFTALDLARLFNDAIMVNALDSSSASSAKSVDGDGQLLSITQQKSKLPATHIDQGVNSQTEVEWEGGVNQSDQRNASVTLDKPQSTHIHRSDTQGAEWKNVELDDTSRHLNDQAPISGQNHDRLLLERDGDIYNVINCVNAPLTVRGECGQAVAARRRSDGNGGSDDAAEQAVVQSSRNDVESEPVLFLGGQPIVRYGSRAVLSNRQERNSTGPSTNSKDEVNDA
ncbi:SPT3 Dosage dependent suppressor of Ty-induced promoter mutations-like protein [Mortierella sp. AD011]|nr:SPT3 Dosage dependent suppressor of Ty-induced promoter mutations-like protein [Mortierella sp. AD010]KAF9402931.1 SPT3 Dosage dependent suppressor of Ty-induced promoter mutations-like protein [Mortierella sp. AD011]